MKEKALSAGTIIYSPKGILLAHATRTPRWDIPKGHVELGESPIEAAIRECYEETNIDISSYKTQMNDLGEFSYLSTKNLHLFELFLNKPFNLINCCCHTHVIMKTHQFPETDQWAWVKQKEIKNYIGKGLQHLFEIHKIIKHEKKIEPPQKY